MSNIKMTPSDSEGKKNYIKKLKKTFTLLIIHFCYVIFPPACELIFDI